MLSLPAPVLAMEKLPLRGPVVFWTPWMWWMAGAALLVVVLVIWLWRRHRRRAPAGPPPPSAYEVAKRELEAARPLMDANQPEAFSMAVSNVLRRYIESQFSMPAPEQTTEEFLSQAMLDDTLRGPLSDLLADFLQACDLVKFARQSLAPERMKEMFEKAGYFVEESHQRFWQRLAAQRSGDGTRAGTPSQATPLKPPPALSPPGRETAAVRPPSNGSASTVDD